MCCDTVIDIRLNNCVASNVGLDFHNIAYMHIILMATLQVLQWNGL